MPAQSLVIDTNVIIDDLRAKDKQSTILYSLPDELTCYISAVTLYELHRGATTADKKIDVLKLTEGVAVLPFNEEVVPKALEIYYELRNRHLLIEFRDIFIGATCIVFDLPVKTTNRKHFDRFQGIKFF